ncbi:hypothetical protein ACFPOI_17155 [Nonomuraea angiospora]|nr:hypothetical protein [Nonomuraea angiospora]
MKAATLDRRTGRPVPGGLLCPEIFGPDRDDACTSSEHHSSQEAGQVCGRCGRCMPVPRQERERRFGHIELPVPVVHPWYVTGAAGARLARSLRMSEEELRRIAGCELALVTDPDTTTLYPGQLVDPEDWPFNPIRPHAATAVTGAAAMRFLLDRAAVTDAATPSRDTILLQRLPVLPPSLRPCFRADDSQTRNSDLNDLYSGVFTSIETFARMDNSWPVIPWLGAYQAFQSRIDALLGGAREPEPVQGTNARPRVNLAARLLSRWTTGPLRDDFLHRSVDYSARARLVIGRLLDRAEDDADPGTVTLGRDLALRLVEPHLVHALVANGAAKYPSSAHVMIQDRSEEALRLLETVCERSLILVAFPHGPWRLIALRPQVDETPALQVTPELLDLVSWENLGKPVRIFSVLTDEARKEAAHLLTLDALRTAPAARPPRPSTPNSFFDLPCADLPARLAETVFTGDALPIAPDDGLLLCDPGWLSSPGS